jgi:hypothetical protein
MFNIEFILDLITKWLHNKYNNIILKQFMIEQALVVYCIANLN